jgi:hypothetical protein
VETVGFESNCAVSHACLRNGLCEIAIDDLIQRVNGFSFTMTATQDKDAGNELELRVVGHMTAALAVFPKHNVWDANGLAAVPAQHTAGRLRRQFDRHDNCSLRSFGLIAETGGYKLAREFVHRQDSKGLRKRKVTVITPIGTRKHLYFQ